MTSSISTIGACVPSFLWRTTRKAAKFPITIAMHDPSANFDAAKHTVDTYVRSGMTVGLGAGQASAMAIQYLGHKLRAGTLRDVRGVPTSITSASEAAVSGIPLEQYQENLQIDFAFDDADALQENSLLAIIGRRKLQGGESIIEEKEILNAAKDLVFMINETKFKSVIEGSVPVLIQSENWMDTAEVIDDLFLGDAEVWRRPAIGHAGPSGGDYPFITKEGHNILDVIFTSPIPSLADVAESLEQVAGVAGHGIIAKLPCHAVITCQRGLWYADNVQTNVL